MRCATERRGVLAERVKGGEAVTTVRVATFNIENFDETPSGARPALDERIALMRPSILDAVRFNAFIAVLD